MTSDEKPQHINVGIDFGNKDSLCFAIKRGDLIVSTFYDDDAKSVINEIISAQQQPVNAELLEALKRSHLFIESYDGETAVAKTMFLNFLKQTIARAEQKGG